MTRETIPTWIHPQDHVHRRRWMGPVGPPVRASRPETPRFA